MEFTKLSIDELNNTCYYINDLISYEEALS